MTPSLSLFSKKVLLAIERLNNCLLRGATQGFTTQQRFDFPLLQLLKKHEVKSEEGGWK